MVSVLVIGAAIAWLRRAALPDLLAIALAIAAILTLAGGAGRHEHRLARCLALYAVACIVAGVAPKNQPGTAPTVISQVHVAAAVLAGALVLGAMTLVSRCGGAPADFRWPR